MEVIYLLIPLALLLVLLMIAIFFWAVKSGQFDDLEGPAHRILLDDDEHPVEKDSNQDNKINNLKQEND